MKIRVLPGRDMFPIFYEHPDGKRFVRFVGPSNFDQYFEIPDKSKILTIDSIAEKNAP